MDLRAVERWLAPHLNYEPEGEVAGEASPAPVPNSVVV
jgi:hypothetical protein